MGGWRACLGPLGRLGLVGWLVCGISGFELELGGVCGVVVLALRFSELSGGAIGRDFLAFVDALPGY